MGIDKEGPREGSQECDVGKFRRIHIVYAVLPLISHRGNWR